jgi:hypothetical protein
MTYLLHLMEQSPTSTYIVTERDDANGTTILHQFSSAKNRHQWYIDHLGLDQPKEWFLADPCNRLYIDEHEGRLYLHWVYHEYSMDNQFHSEGGSRTIKELKEELLDDDVTLDLSMDRSPLVWQSLTGSLTVHS